jgi:hypothetical protein
LGLNRTAISFLRCDEQFRQELVEAIWGLLFLEEYIAKSDDILGKHTAHLSGGQGRLNGGVTFINTLNNLAGYRRSERMVEAVNNQTS